MESQSPSLDAVFPGYRACEVSVVSEQLMGFSGAKIQDIAVARWERLEADEGREDEVIVKDTEEGHSLPSLIFVKHIVFNDLGPEASEVARQKDIRNRHSYTNETAFIDCVIPRLEKTGDFFFPRTYKVLHEAVCGEQDQETFTFFTQSLTHMAQQVAVLEADQLHTVLTWTARLHAVFHGTVDLPQDEVNAGKTFVEVMARHPLGLWSQGTHLAWEKRPAAEVNKLSTNWKALCESFSWNDLEDLGDRLAATAPFVAQQLSVANQRNAGRTTVVHGDVKPGNMFFVHEKKGATGSCDVTLIDYQWSGIAMGVTDIVYLLATSASDEFIKDLDLEEGLLRPYYTAFTSTFESVHKDIDAKAAVLQYSFEELMNDFQLAVLDYVRWAVSCRLGGETPAKYAGRRQVVDPNLGSYRRSENMLRFLLKLVEKYLPSVEERKGTEH